MSQIIAIVILSGAACISPIESRSRTTVAHQVPCAKMIYAPSANPFKLAQQPNEVSMAPAKDVAKMKPKKKKRKARR